jgi:hypothetical protein
MRRENKMTEQPLSPKKPLQSLFTSRKFITLLIDVGVSLGIYFITKYADPSAGEDALILIAALQTVFLAYIGGTALEDAAAKRSGTFKY